MQEQPIKTFETMYIHVVDHKKMQQRAHKLISVSINVFTYKTTIHNMFIFYIQNTGLREQEATYMVDGRIT